VKVQLVKVCAIDVKYSEQTRCLDLEERRNLKELTQITTGSVPQIDQSFALDDFRKTLLSLFDATKFSEARWTGGVRKHV
jgi:hypothetical protein